MHTNIQQLIIKVTNNLFNYLFNFNVLKNTKTKLQKKKIS